MFKQKIESEEKLITVHLILAGKESQRGAAVRLGVSVASIQQWLCIYKSEGEEAFIVKKPKHYSKDLKENAVLDYLNGKGSLQAICQRYGIRAKSKLQKWIKQYNGHKELKASGTGGTAIMTKGRKTTFDERVEIVKYCIAHDHNYAETAAKYSVSYQQARSYTVKYETGGVEALRDRRGRSKSWEEMSELERLRAENRILRAEKERAEMEASFLKKLSEIERRRD
jgi:transposase-like protein